MYSCSPNPCGDIYLRKPNPYIEEVRTYLRTGDGDRETDQFYTGRCGNYNEGNLRSIQQYKDGLDHGKWVFYYESGEIETVANFEMGEREGKWKYYHENGSLKQVSYYKNGERDGTWFRLSQEGDTIWTEKYEPKSATN
tara:strand:+ start:126 stop:542 length:417 start_codon:yes stop_codon:yes gene_type:complete